MARRPPTPATALGAAVQARRGATSQAALGTALGVAETTISHVERGTHRPSTDTARALARWLGWSMEQVIEAADQPAPSSDAPGQTP